ncbi:long-chain-fatty-acid--CoA ligase [Parvularcula flava]|uniref:Long-chain-fatty-acid--CoA ligase n=2 Tax=Aquisalinus luteolus TaxID=1566827 RepID=A0A8J3A1C3_9PROT|nr:long-chain-fatty-acid--CoA ligase [Aquisalinus luteolus]NHK26587.1 long-chain-fatty-acid--CoA ligase [Aquisalinus luteolus]GGH92791.1 long-chain-fatty-acid--CoA ligase [Aquisalinus luteolus]
MQGLMMDTPLLISGILKHAVRTFADQEIVTSLVEGGKHRYTYKQAEERICQLAHALQKMGVKMGDRVGVIGWNTHRQLELYYAISSIGAVCHTINPRLGPENAGFVINHAGDKFMFYDITFAPLVEALGPHLKTVEKYVVMTDKDHAPESKLNPETYEELIAGEEKTFDWPLFDENTASGMCYTSGTTGQPKGVLYSHRSTVIQTFVTSLATSFGADHTDTILPVVPMFHVNAWNVPYSALMGGAKLVLPGPGMDGESLHTLIEEEGVTYSLGVPTIWLGLLGYVNAAGKTFSTMKYTLVGGAALSEKIVKGYEAHGVRVRQGWGMTEMSPTGTVNFEEKGFYDQPQEERLPKQLKQGKALPFVEMRLVSDEGRILPHDGETSGHLQVRGPSILSAYYNYEGDTLTPDGWFDTGDVAVIDPEGMMSITDRAKDVIKSGGEWISTIDIENAALSHPEVVNAAVIGIAHPKWDERPLLICQPAPDTTPDAEEVRQFVCKQVPKISCPDAVEFVKEIPIGATGKVLKTRLREMFKDYVLPEFREGGSAPAETSSSNDAKELEMTRKTNTKPGSTRPQSGPFSFFRRK